ncbi:MAG: hypothetical protein ACM3KM_00470 [Acidobacteriaceae bacterium]
MRRRHRRNCDLPNLWDFDVLEDSEALQLLLVIDRRSHSRR